MKNGKNNIPTSAELRRQTGKSIIGILTFSISYLVMLVLATGITAACVFAGIWMIVAFPRFFIIAIGAGVISFGVLILIFLLKFMFKSHKIDRSQLREIQEADEPELFHIIHEIVDEVGTSRPKKVYLSADVNAAVFYDSGFWSMFLPIKKNLQIGVGLVNTVTQSELKAILSHEFGHFSQKTMKVGSYVYNVNQVIFNMLYDNESYENLIRQWANISSYIGIFVVLAAKVICGLQWVLKKLYNIVNISYMGLSREMEFQADEIATHITGYEPLKSSLSRLPLAEYSLNAAISFYEEKINNSLQTENIYKEQFYIMTYLATQEKISLVNDLPEITLEQMKGYNKSNIIIKDQWASHPNTEDRIIRMMKGGIPSTDRNNRPANELLQQIEEIQKEFTKQLLANFHYPAEPALFPLDEFVSEYEKKYLANTFPNLYNEYYDNKAPTTFDIPLPANTDNRATSVEELFATQKVDWVRTANALENDIDILKQIDSKEISIKEFEYNGIKYQRKHCKDLLLQLSQELETINVDIKQNDIEIFCFFSNHEQKNRGTNILPTLYKEFIAFQEEYQSKIDIYIHLSDALSFVNKTTPFEEIKENFLKIEALERKLKEEIRSLLPDPILQPEISEEARENFEMYLSGQLTYFSGEQYFDDNLSTLFKSLNEYIRLTACKYFLLKKNLLIYQAEIISSSNT